MQGPNSAGAARCHRCENVGRRQVGQPFRAAPESGPGLDVFAQVSHTGTGGNLNDSFNCTSFVTPEKQDQCSQTCFLAVWGHLGPHMLGCYQAGADTTVK